MIEENRQPDNTKRLFGVIGEGGAGMKNVSNIIDFKGKKGDNMKVSERTVFDINSMEDIDNMTPEGRLLITALAKINVLTGNEPEAILNELITAEVMVTIFGDSAGEIANYILSSEE